MKNVMGFILKLIGGAVLLAVNLIILAFGFIGFFAAGGNASLEDKGVEGHPLQELIEEGFIYFFG